jgi:hypothetical protein
MICIIYYVYYTHTYIMYKDMHPGKGEVGKMPVFPFVFNDLPVQWLRPRFRECGSLGHQSPMISIA